MLDEVLAAKGLDRTLLMARFLQSATSAELGEVIQRTGLAGDWDLHLTAMAWERWVEIDHEAALKYNDTPGLRYYDEAGPWIAWAKQNPQAALEAALKKSPPEHLDAVLRGLAGSDPALARKMMAEYPDLRRSGQDAVLEGLVKHDPPAAMKAAREMGVSYAQREFQKWLRQDPGAARAWMEGVTDAGERRLLETATLSELTVSNPAAAMREIAGLPLGVRQTRLIANAMSELGRQDPAAARLAAEALPSAYARSQALAVLAGGLASQDAGAAAALIPGIDWNLLKDSQPAAWQYTGPDGKAVSGKPTDWWGNPQDGKATRTLLTKLMSGDPQRTAEALAALPESSRAPVSAAIGAWAGQQPEAASAWVRDLPDGPARDSGIEGLATWLARDSPDPDFPAALEWAQSASPDRRFDILQQTFTAWKRKDPAAARRAAATAMETLPVTAEQREILIRSLQ
ncbi:MAG: hypothetical protein V4726_18665 [Verrucomicrobiota bacterium]